ncbi:autotransporter domain-containing protein [Ruegeria atlantica]|uniref:autotransporter domain-containing protein n=1 Tax=Ruegeria atlantica TaxID=81569 RepID=UPI00147D241C|nr:autotransporter domain-containing protein [Ruegeria atlantica]
MITSALIGSAAGVASLAMPTDVQAQVVPGDPQCTTSGTTVSCSGDLQAGVAVAEPVETLNVNNVDAEGIAPATGVEGISFVSEAGDLTLNADTTGSGGIITSGNGTRGIMVDHQGPNGNINVSSNGDVNAIGDGIRLRTDVGDVTLTSMGDVTSMQDEAIDIDVEDGNVTVDSVGNLSTQTGMGEEAIRIDVDGDGDVTVRSTGNITTNQDGIEVDVDGTGDIVIESTGDVTANSNDGLDGTTEDGSISITSTGTIRANDNGIEADAAGNITISSTGDISARGSGIETNVSGDSNVDGNVRINTNGDIDAINHALNVNLNGTGNVEIANNGNLSSRAETIFVLSNGDNVTLQSTGDVTSERARGIVVFRSDGDGNIDITQTGNIVAAGTGIDAQLNPGAVGNILITSQGNVTTQQDLASGIRAVQSELGAIEVNSTGNLSTAGSEAHAIRAENLGDADGDISISSTGNINTTGDTSAGIFANTDTATSRTNVQVISVGNITTQGVDSDGILVNEEGSGAVAVTSTGDITTRSGGADAIEIRANGEGNASVASEGNLETQSTSASGINVTKIGGMGDVSIETTGNIQTTGDTSHGLTALNRNGGNTTINSTGVISTSGASANGIRVQQQGGSGDTTIRAVGEIRTSGTIGSGILTRQTQAVGNISVEAAANIETQGNQARGIDVTTFNAVDDSSVAVVATGNIATTGNDAIGILISDSGAGRVEINTSGNISTRGEASTGVVAFHVGGGSTAITSGSDIVTQADRASGIAGTNFDGEGDLTIQSTGTITTAGRLAIAIGAAKELGTGNVSIRNTGQIETTGIEARGIFALRNGLGDIEVTTSNTIRTEGAQADGIFAVGSSTAQISNISVSSMSNISTGGSGASGIEVRNFSAGSIDVVSTGEIATRGDQASGIEALNSGSGDTAIRVSNRITAEGESADGIRVTGSATDTSTVSISGATVQGGSGESSAVRFFSASGATNIVNTTGEVVLSSLGGSAVIGGAGNTTINNFGTLTTTANGAITLGEGTNAFNNQAGGSFNAGDVVNLGAGNTLTNDGMLSPGGRGTIATTSVTGRLVQSESGRFAVDLNLDTGASDRLNVSETAALNGTVDVNVLSGSNRTQQFTILSAAGGTTNEGVTLNGFTLSPILQAELQFPNANDVVLATNVNFAAPGAGLNANQRSTANAINAAFEDEDESIAPVTGALLNDVSSAVELKQAYDQLGAEGILSSETNALLNAQSFTNQLFSCQVTGVEYAAISEGSCIWARPQTRQFDQDSTSDSVGFDSRTHGISIGGQLEFRPDWFAGFALAYESGNVASTSGVNSDFDSYSVGLSLKHTLGRLVLSGAISGGSGDFDTTRAVTFGGLNASNTSNYDVDYLSAQLRAAYLIEYSAGYLKPMVDANLTRVKRNGFTESGTSATALTVDSNSETYFSLSPALEFGRDRQISDTLALRAYGKIGATYFNNADTSVTARLGDGPDFTNSAASDKLFADVEAGVTFFAKGDRAVQIGYQGRFSDSTRINSAFVKGSIKF